MKTISIAIDFKYLNRHFECFIDGIAAINKEGGYLCGDKISNWNKIMI